MTQNHTAEFDRPDSNAASESAEGQGGEAQNPQTGNAVKEEEARADAVRDRMQRMQAEFENARKRMRREQEEFHEFALADALRSLLPVLDSFDRALENPANNPEQFREGVELIRKQLHGVMSNLGLTAIPAKDEVFDPQVHEALDMVDTGSSARPRVVDELQRGYKLRDRLLRPARVRVAGRH